MRKPAFQAHTQWSGGEPTRILFVRHGETSWNVQRRIQGWRGTGLNALGRAQAALLARRVAGLGLGFQALLSSDLLRARQTAEALGRALRLPLRTEPLLRERAFGDWEGQRVEDVLKRFKLGPKARKDPFLSFDPEGGESMAAFARRTRAFMSKALREHAGQTVLAVTHGGPVRIAACLASGIPSKRYFVLGRPGNVSLTLLAHQGGVWWVERYNDMAHLEKGRR